jgi:porin
LFDSVAALRLPYSTLGAGVLWLPTKHLSVNSVIINTQDSSTTTGFNDFGHGQSWTTEVDSQYRLRELPGGMNVGGLYSFDQDFARLNRRLIFQPGEGLVVPKKHSTWALYWSTWQYLLVADPDNTPIDVADGRPDHKGLGLFARAGVADKDTNPVEWSVSGGLSGRGLIPSRDNDVYGVGYYYSRIQKTLLTGVLGVQDHSQGMEAFYNVALTPAAQLTFDMQVQDAPLSSIDTAVILGLRLNLRF